MLLFVKTKFTHLCTKFLNTCFFATIQNYYRHQGKLMFSQASLGHSVHRPHGYSVLAHPCYSLVGMHPTGMLYCLTCCSGIYFIMICLHVKSHKPQVMFLLPSNFSRS